MCRKGHLDWLKITKAYKKDVISGVSINVEASEMV
jgi:hypothetical protein